MATEEITVLQPQQMVDDVRHDCTPNKSQLTIAEGTSSLFPTPVGPSVPRSDKGRGKGKERNGTRNGIPNCCAEDIKALLDVAEEVELLRDNM